MDGVVRSCRECGKTINVWVNMRCPFCSSRLRELLVEV